MGKVPNAPPHSSDEHSDKWKKYPGTRIPSKPRFNVVSVYGKNPAHCGNSFRLGRFGDSPCSGVSYSWPISSPRSRLCAIHRRGGLVK